MKKIILAASLLAAFSPAQAAANSPYSHVVNADNLGRGVLAVKADTGVFVSWRSMPDDDANLTFDVYRDGVKVNETPISKYTNFTDPEGTVDSKYCIKAVLNGNEIEASNASDVWASNYMKIHLDRPEGGTSPAGGKQEQREYTYTPDDVSVGDVDGDGEYEFIVKWHPTNAADNSHTRYTGNTFIDCYELDGTKLWRIDLGHNIRSGNHYTQFMVYDFDLDGKAELMCKTAPGTIDGTGTPVLMGDDKVTDDYRDNVGTVLSGPEYLTVFNGLTGASINTIAYNPPRSIRQNNKNSDGWGDNYGNRSERYLAGVAYLDGQKPSGIFVRGYYTASYVWAVDFDGEKLTERWFHNSQNPGAESIYGQGTHSLSIADLDGDGFDEIIIGSGAIDHDGSFMHSTGCGHGDALHVGDFVWENEGLEIYMPHEDKSGKYATTLRDGKTGKILFAQTNTGIDNGRGLIANISSKFDGGEYWSSLNGNVMNSGNVVGTTKPSTNFRVYWDGDLNDELLDGSTITKINEDLTSISNLAVFGAISNATSCNSTKKTPNLQADIFGDWREEVILHDGSTESDLIIFTTTISSPYKVPCLMTDRQYRVAIAWQNVAYNQPPHLSYDPESKFDTRPRIVLGGGFDRALSLGDAMEDIEFSIVKATGVEVSGLPAGVSYTFDETSLSGVISGTPEAEGEWTYTITTVGAEDGENISVKGTISVIFVDKSGILAKFSFDEIGSSSVANEIRDGLQAEIHGNVSAEANGVNNGAVAFDGKGYLTQPIYDELQFGDGNFSIELWMKSTDDDGYLFCVGTHNKTNVEGGTGNWVGLERLKNSSNDRLAFTIDDDVTKTDCYASNPGDYFDGNWHHIVCVRNTTEKSTSIYIDGKLNSQTANVGTGAIKYSATELMWIGGDDEPTSGRENRTFNGSLDELSIYPFAMSADDVATNYAKYDLSAVESIIGDSVNAGISVVDAFTGRIIKCVEGQSLSAATSGLENGIYIIVIEENGVKKAHKIIKH